MLKSSDRVFCTHRVGVLWNSTPHSRLLTNMPVQSVQQITAELDPENQTAKATQPKAHATYISRERHYCSCSRLCIHVHSIHVHSFILIHVYFSVLTLHGTQHEYQERLKLQVYHLSGCMFAASNVQTSFLSTEGSAILNVNK